MKGLIFGRSVDMCELSVGDPVAWVADGKEFQGTVQEFLKSDEVFLDHGGSLPLQAKRKEGGWFAYSGHGDFLIPVHRIEPT